METPWSLIESTFSPAQAEQITGVSTGLQRQWRNRRLLVAASRGRASITVNGLIELSVLRECSEARIGLEAVTRALPSLCAEATFHLALMTDRWAFFGGDEALEQFRNWAGPNDMLGAEYISSMLPDQPKDLGRYMVIRSTTVRLLNDLQELMDEFPEKPAVLLDSWGIARGLVKRTSKPFFWVRKAAGPQSMR